MAKLISKDWKRFLLSAILVALISVLNNAFLTDATRLVIYINALEKIAVFLILGFLFLLFKQDNLIKFENYKSIFIFSLLVSFLITILEMITAGDLGGTFLLTLFVRFSGAFLGILIGRLLYR